MKDAVELAEFYILQHLTENPGLEEVAAEACVSATILQDCLRRNMIWELWISLQRRK